MRAKTSWRSPALGERKEIELPHGTLPYFESGSGPTLVFVHGYFVNANLWRRVVPRLAENYRCIVLDLPFGSHALPMHPDADLSERGILDLILGAIEKIGLDDITLVGMDTGGAICQFIVTQHPERVARLVLCSCDYRDNFPPRIFTHLKLLPYITPAIPILFAPFRLRAVRRLPTGFGWLSHNQVERVVEDTWALPGLEDAGVRRDIVKAISIFNKRRLNEAADQLHTFKKPALIAWSADDKAMPPEHGEGLARDLPNARLTWIEGARTLSMEDQPEQLADAIRQFLAESVESRERTTPEMTGPGAIVSAD